MYEGTVRLLLEYGATLHEHMKVLEGSKLDFFICYCIYE